MKNYCISCGQKAPEKNGRLSLGSQVRNWISSPIAKLALLPVPVFLLYLVYWYEEPSTYKAPSVSSVYTIRTVVKPRKEKVLETSCGFPPASPWAKKATSTLPTPNGTASSR